MIPIGYMAKRVLDRPEWLTARGVADIFSVSSCMSEDFADYVGYWKHNGYWFFDSPEIILELAARNTIDVTATTLFYYEAHEREYDGEEGRWLSFQPEASLTTRVVPPDHKVLEGYDIVSFSAGTSAECSPLSCNALASEIETNEHCLLASFERARALLAEGRFENAEPGPYRIFAVYSTAWPSPSPE